VKGAVHELELSPKLTHVFAIASSSVAVTVTVTGDPSVADNGAVTLTVGATSLIVMEVVAVPVRPAASVALAVIVKLLLATPPVE
jgi:hypothetical protein